MTRFVAALLIAGAIGLITGIQVFQADFWLNPPSKRLAILWTQDLRQLDLEKKLPQAWGDIGQIEVEAESTLVAEWLDEIDVPIHTKKGGRHKLQVFLLHWIDGYEHGVVVQYHIVDLRTRNTIWELSRTYRIGFLL